MEIKTAYIDFVGISDDNRLSVHPRRIKEYNINRGHKKQGLSA